MAVAVGAPVPAPTLASPGLTVHGFVRTADGSGLPGVVICRSYAAYAGVPIATTGPDGSFHSDFAYIPGDEMIAVWPAAAGYAFAPQYSGWRHYHGVEDRGLDFVASSSDAATPAPVPCS